MTLKEIFEKHGPYTKVQSTPIELNKTIWCLINVSQFDRDYFILENDLGNAQLWPINSQDWELYVEPKPKVKRWLFVFGGKRMSNYYLTEDEAKQHDKDGIKLEWSEQEFDE